MTLKDYYYKHLPQENPQKQFKEKVMRECGISNPTFHYWIRHNNAPKLAQEKISELTNIPVEELFPD